MLLTNNEELNKRLAEASKEALKIIYERLGEDANHETLVDVLTLMTNTVIVQPGELSEEYAGHNIGVFFTRVVSFAQITHKGFFREKDITVESPSDRLM